MKFSKIMKSEKVTKKSVKSVGMNSAAVDMVSSYFTPKKPFFLDTSRVSPAGLETPVFRTSPLTKLFQFKSSASSKDVVSNALAKQKLIECLLQTPRAASGLNLTPHNANATKRLQRNRLQHVKAKPNNYMLRSTALLNDWKNNETQSILPVSLALTQMSIKSFDIS